MSYTKQHKIALTNCKITKLTIAVQENGKELTIIYLITISHANFLGP